MSMYVSLALFGAFFSEGKWFVSFGGEVKQLLPFNDLFVVCFLVT